MVGRHRRLYLQQGQQDKARERPDDLWNSYREIFLKEFDSFTIEFQKTQLMNQSPKDGISLAEWALVEEIRAGKWKNLDFPRIAREDFGLDGIEFVNTLFESPTETYLQRLKQNANDQGVKMVLIMVDEEGDGCAETKKGRKQFETNHRKWVDIAHYLGCHAIRTNCRGPENVDKKEALEWAAESYNMLLEYAGT